MAPSLYTSPFPKLRLTLEEKAQLRRTASELVAEAQQLYEKHLSEDNGRPDATRWSLIREREDVRVFYDQRPGAGTSNERMQLLLTEGSVQGALNDAMYGVLNHTTEDIRIKTAYVQDTLVDNAVLETLLEPTPENPYQSMTVRWFVKGIPLIARMISKPGDNVYLEFVGMQRLSNGEHVGFHLMHSVAFATTPVLPQYLRVNSSICSIYRQANANRVQVFATTYIEKPTHVPTLMFVRAVGDAAVSAWKLIECAQRKKLAWLIQHRSGTSTATDRANTLSQGCCVCGVQSGSARRGIRWACAVCADYVCSKCRVKHELSTFTPDRKLLKLKMRFCFRCVTEATRLDAAVCAQHEAAACDLSSIGRAPHGGPRKFSSAPLMPSASSSHSELVHSLDGPSDRRQSCHVNAGAVSAASTASRSDSASWLA